MDKEIEKDEVKKRRVGEKEIKTQVFRNSENLTIKKSKIKT